MTEREYIDCGELRIIRDSTRILSDIVVGNSKVIRLRDYQKVMKTLYNWEDLLTERCHTKE